MVAIRKTLFTFSAPNDLPNNLIKHVLELLITLYNIPKRQVFHIGASGHDFTELVYMDI
jgi:hypothetical protein